MPNLFIQSIVISTYGADSIDFSMIIFESPSRVGSANNNPEIYWLEIFPSIWNSPEVNLPFAVIDVLSLVNLISEFLNAFSYSEIPLAISLSVPINLTSS